MIVLYEWLRKFVELPEPAATLADRLSLGGLAAERVWQDQGATLLDLDTPSNRPDLLGHYGVARELAAILDRALAPLEAPGLAAPASGAIPVLIEAPDCGRYLALRFDNAAIGNAPDSIARRLAELGHRNINFWADVTNYTLWETGHPTHAFDFDTLRGGEIRVRHARAGERLVTLDAVERRLTPEDLVIADAERPIALAGVIGGLETAISERTQRVALESAWFDPLTVRRTARRHGIYTDASHRFERGADPEACEVAAARIAARARERGARLAGRSMATTTIPRPALIALRAVALGRMLGQAVNEQDCARHLQALGCRREADGWRMPSWRADLAREIDLIEEVARLHGLERFPARLPTFAGVARPLPEAALRDRVRRQFRGRGFAETISLSFASEPECARFRAARPVRVLNPLSEEAAILRTSSLPAMLHGLRHNLNHGVSAPRLFEIGKLYELAAGVPTERAVLTLGGCDAGLDFAGFKGEIEAVLALFDWPPTACTADAPPYLHPGRSARLENFGVFGQIHPELAAEWKLPAQTWLAEIDLAALYALGPRRVTYAPPSRYPASERDFSFLFDDAVTWRRIAATLTDAPISHLAGFQPAEIYQGEHVLAGHHSLLLRARFQSPDRTLREDEIQAAADEIVRRLRALGGTQR